MNELGVSTHTIRRWIDNGLLPAEQTTPGAPWRIRLTDDIRALGEWQAGAGVVALAAEARGDLPVVLVLGEAADQLDDVVPELVALEFAGDPERHAELGPRAAFPVHLDVGTAFVVLAVTITPVRARHPRRLRAAG